MFSKRLILLLILFVLIFLAACAPTVTATASIPTAEPTQIPLLPTPTPTMTKLPTAVPPTNTPPILITSADLLIGTWQPLSSSQDAMFILFNADGTCRQSYWLSGLTGLPEVECIYKFEGAHLSMTAVQLNTVPACPNPAGIYDVQVVTDNQIRLVKVEDTCARRVRSTMGRYQRIP